jgi:hypothetical protein
MHLTINAILRFILARYLLFNAVLVLCSLFTLLIFAEIEHINTPSLLDSLSMSCFMSWGPFGFLFELLFSLFNYKSSVNAPYTTINQPSTTGNKTYTSNLVRPSPFEPYIYTDLAFGSQSFKVLLDTGSSDTWLLSSEFTCLIGKAPQPQSECNAGPLYYIDGNFTEIPGQKLHAQYSRAVADGYPGTVPVTLAGLTTTAEVGIVEQLVSLRSCLLSYTDWCQSNPGGSMAGLASGILGLAFSPITSNYPANVPWSPNVTYIPSKSIMTTIFESREIPHKFSLAVSRGAEGSSDGGTLTIGGLPNLDDPRVNATNDFASTPLTPSVDFQRTYIAWYTITVDGFYYGTLGNMTANTNSTPYILDSGAPTIDLPPDDYERWLSMFEPRIPRGTKEDPEVSCNATIPILEFRIGGKLFPLNPVDLVVLIGGRCYSKVGKGAPPYTLGDRFYRNVLAVHDWENEQIQ